MHELGIPPRVEEAPDPAPASGETLVEVLATPLNPIDIAVAAGRWYGGHPPLPFVPGCESVGRLESGELVWAHGGGLGTKRNGGLAERVAVPDGALIRLPEGTDPALAGAVGIAGLAGWLPLAWRAPVRKGETVLVLGATGTVGLVAVQAARILGAGRVVAAGRSEEALARAAEVGADATVQLGGDDDAAALRDACGGDGPNLIADPLWGKPATAAVEAAAPGARLVQIGQSAGPEATFRSNDVRGKQLEILGYSNYAAPHDVAEREYRTLIERASSGELRVDLETVPFAELADAWRRQSETANVKLVVVR